MPIRPNRALLAFTVISLAATLRCFAATTTVPVYALPLQFIRGTVAAQIDPHTVLVRDTRGYLDRVHLRSDTRFYPEKFSLRPGTGIVVLGEPRGKWFIAGEVDRLAAGEAAGIASRVVVVPGTAASARPSGSRPYVPTGYSTLSCVRDTVPVMGTLQYLDCSQSPYGATPYVQPVFIAVPRPPFAPPTAPGIPQPPGYPQPIGFPPPVLQQPVQPLPAQPIP